MKPSVELSANFDTVIGDFSLICLHCFSQVLDVYDCCNYSSRVSSTGIFMCTFATTGLQCFDLVRKYWLSLFNRMMLNINLCAGLAETDSLSVNLLEKKVILTCKYPGVKVPTRQVAAVYSNPLSKIAMFKRIFRSTSS